MNVACPLVAQCILGQVNTLQGFSSLFKDTDSTKLSLMLVLLPHIRCLYSLRSLHYIARAPLQQNNFLRPPSPHMYPPQHKLRLENTVKTDILHHQSTKSYPLQGLSLIPLVPLLVFLHLTLLVLNHVILMQ